MPAIDRPLVVIPADDPPQLTHSTRLDALRERAEVLLFEDRPVDDAEKIERVKQADVIINSRGAIKWPGEALALLPKLKMIGVCGIGTDSVDLVAAREQGIVVSNIPGKTAPVVAEHAFALLMAVARCTAFQTAEMKAGRWTRALAVSLTGKTLGVVGTGNIGCEMIRMARGFGMNVIAWSYHPSDEKAQKLGFRYVEFDELLKTSDAVSLHVKLTDDSRGLIGQRELAMMKPGSLLVNTARGAVLDTDALINSLNSHHLAGAGLDVFEVEPFPQKHPLLECEHVVLTPHAADQTPDGVDLLNIGCVENVLAYLDGKPQNMVT